jgi:D-alanine-D-alanine ligase
MTLLETHRTTRTGRAPRATGTIARHRTARRRTPMTVTHHEEPVPWPVVILYNVDSSWTEAEVQEAEGYLTIMADGLKEQEHPVELAPVRSDVAEPLQRFDPREHIIFNWCEGIDGIPRSYDRIPPILEELGFAYTGASAWTLATTQDKSVAKKLLDQRCIPTPAWRTFQSADEVKDWDNFPAIVKPAAEHCSFGITDGAVVSNLDQLRNRVATILQTWGGLALVEEFIVGREFNVAIWGNGRPAPLPLYEIDFSDVADPHQWIVDYDAKWTKGSFMYEHTYSRCPAQVDEDTAERIRTVAMEAYRVLRLRDYGRIDMRVRDGQPYVVDVNANCDITVDGGFVKTTAAAGYSYGAAISRIINFAAHRKAP